MKGRRGRGAVAEEAARRYLERRGYRTIARNAATRFGEIDIVAESPRGHVTVFVEVRSVSGDGWGDPAESLGREKIAHLLKAAWHFLLTSRRLTKPFRFDFIGVHMDGAGITFDHRVSFLRQEDLDGEAY